MYKLFKGIVAHRRLNNAVDKADQYRQVGNKRVKKKTTAGWEVEIEWREGFTSWLPMKEVKATNSVELAEYAVANRIDHEPAFDWWVRPTLKRKKRLIKLSQRRHARSGYKFGIKLPCNIEEALAIDKENDNTLWYDAIMKELGKVRVAFQPLDQGSPPPSGYQQIPYHWVFDIKMDFTRKARLVARGYKVESPPASTYSSVVSRDSIRIIFLVAALNDLNTWMSDVGNAYLNAKPREKVYVILGKEFGDQAGQYAIIVRALYGLPGSGSAYHAHYASSLRELGFESSLADPDVWRRRSTKRDGTPYYEYLLVYVDDQLTVSENPKAITDALSAKPFNYELKDVDPPNHYLGARVGPYDLDGRSTWYFSADDYLEKAIRNVEEQHGRLEDLFCKSKLGFPSSPDYHPELDQSDFCAMKKSTCIKATSGSFVGLSNSNVSTLRTPEQPWPSSWPHHERVTLTPSFEYSPT
ncbi:hypothetical protein ACA910_022004 [Epithemia clementina (nom. ined.)]